MTRKPTHKPGVSVEAFTHEEKRRNIPTAEYGSLVDDETKKPLQVAFERRNRDLDPQLVWRGKDEQDWSDLVVQAPPLYIQEKVHPKVLIEDLLRRSARAEAERPNYQADLFSDFNGVGSDDAKTEFYQHDANWTNRLILGDSLQVMASLAEREGLLRVKINGVDVFHPNTGEVRSDGAEGIACWFIDTDYNKESFFVRQAYFLGANDPYRALKTTLRADINEEAWETLHSDTSRPFEKPESGRIAVKVINHLGDEVMKVFRVG